MQALQTRTQTKASPELNASACCTQTDGSLAHGSGAEGAVPRGGVSCSVLPARG